MNEANSVPSFWETLGREDFGPMTFVAQRKPTTGELRFVISTADVDFLEHSRDFSVLLHCLGWGMVSLGVKLRKISNDALHGYCEVMQKVDYILKW